MSFLLTASDKTIAWLIVRWDRRNQFLIVGFAIAGLVSTFSTVISPGFQMLFVITGSSL